MRHKGIVCALALGAILVVLGLTGCIDEDALRAEIQAQVDEGISEVQAICEEQSRIATETCEARADEAEMVCEMAIEDAIEEGLDEAEDRADQRMRDMGCVEIEGPPGWECPCVP